MSLVINCPVLIVKNNDKDDNKNNNKNNLIFLLINKKILEPMSNAIEVCLRYMAIIDINKLEKYFLLIMVREKSNPKQKKSIS